jgi:hypothetical protein
MRLCDAEAGVDRAAAKPPANLREAAAIRARLAAISFFGFVRSRHRTKFCAFDFEKFHKIRFSTICKI